MTKSCGFYSSRFIGMDQQDMYYSEDKLSGYRNVLEISLAFHFLTIKMRKIFNRKTNSENSVKYFFNQKTFIIYIVFLMFKRQEKKNGRNCNVIIVFEIGYVSYGCQMSWTDLHKVQILGGQKGGEICFALI